MGNLSPLLFLHTYSLRFHFAHKAGFDALAFIDRAAHEGFDGVALSANDANYRYVGRDPAYWKQIRERITHYGLLCDMDTSGTDPAHLRTKLQVAQAIGATKLRTYTRYRGKPDEMVARTIADLRQVVPLAEEMGIHIMLENHESFTGQEIVQVLEAVDSTWIGALYDYGNSQMVLERSLDALAVMGRYALSAHAKDHVVLRAEDSPLGVVTVLGVPLGEGNLPVLEITRRLLGQGGRHIVFENSWGYYAPIKRERMTNANARLLGEGEFAFAEGSFTNERYLLWPEQLAPTDVVALEDAAHRRTLAWFRQVVLSRVI